MSYCLREEENHEYIKGFLCSKAHFFSYIFHFAAMTFYAHNAEWIGYLAENFIQKCVSRAILECTGCRDNMKSDLLHLHHQQSLLQKLQHHFDPIRADLLNSLPTLYKAIEGKLPHSEDKKKDMMIYCDLGRHFLISCSPEALYFGRYINEMNDAFIDDVFKDSKRSKSKKRPPTS